MSRISFLVVSPSSLGISVASAVVGGTGASFWAGMSYFLLGPVAGFHGAMRGRKRGALE